MAFSSITIQQHILEEQQKHPRASGEFSFLLSGITLATKKIQAAVRRAGLNDILGSCGVENVQGELQQKLDVFSNETMYQCVLCRRSVGVMASEENEEPAVTPHLSPEAKYAVVFDPLDGSSNIDVNVSVGTTFSILSKPVDGNFDDPTAWILQPGRNQIAAGYVMYGSSTVLVYTSGSGVYGFTLDPEIGAFIMSHPEIQMPKQGKYYSVNEANRDSFPDPYNQTIDALRKGDMGTTYSSRYIGSMVADFHRTLLKGGIFMYPPTKDNPEGKLRLLYEANPIAMIAEQAGGMATDSTQPILDIIPNAIHQRTPLVVGSRCEMELFHSLANAAAVAQN